MAPATTATSTPPAASSRFRSGWRSNRRYTAGVTLRANTVELASPPMSANPRAFQILASVYSLNSTSGSSPKIVVQLVMRIGRTAIDRAVHDRVAEPNALDPSRKRPNVPWRSSSGEMPKMTIHYVHKTTENVDKETVASVKFV